MDGVVRIIVGVGLVFTTYVSAMMPMGMGSFGGRYMGGMGMGGGMGGTMGGGMGMGGRMGMGGGMGMGSGMGYSGGLKLQGGSEASGGSFGEGKKMLDDTFSKKFFGSEGMQFGMGNSGFGNGMGKIKNMKGDSGFYTGAQGGSNVFKDGKGYYGGKHTGTKGMKMDESDGKKGHKKGRTVKGYHTSHESNEASNSEEVYDEEHDEADKKKLKLEEGKFGENEEKAFKGEKADSTFKSEGGKKEGNFENAMEAGKASAGGEQFGGKKYGADGGSYGVQNGGGITGNSGHQHADKMFKHFKM